MTITVIVDDADPRLQYFEGWSPADPSQLGPVYQGINSSVGSTLHSASFSLENHASFTFAFNGSAISVYAILSTEVAGRAVPPYNWTCFVDDIGTTPIALQPVPQPSTYQLCSASGLSDTAEHMLLFELAPGTNTGLSPSTPILATNTSDETMSILFDYLEYTPLDSNTDRKFDYVSVSYSEPTLVYTGSWTQAVTANGVIGAVSQFSDCSVEYNFTGTSVSWIGILMPVGSGPGLSNTQFSVDGGPAITKGLPSLNGSVDIPNTLLFQSGPLDLSTVHTVKGTSPNITKPLPNEPGSVLWSPLILQSLIIQNGTIPAASSLPASMTNTTTMSPMPTTANPPSTSSISPSTESHTTGSQKRITIAVITGVVVSVILIVVILYLRQQIRRKKQQRRAGQLAEPFAEDQQTVADRDLLYYRNLLLPAEKGVVERQQHNSRLILPPQKHLAHLAQEASGESPDGSQNSQEGQRNASLNVEGGILVRVTDATREQDSGLRRVESIGIEEGISQILPPLYTAE